MLIGAAAVLVAGATTTVLILPSLTGAGQRPVSNFALPAHGSLSSWTEVPTLVSFDTATGAFEVCEKAIDGTSDPTQPGRIVASDQRGEHISMVIDHREHFYYCIVAAGAVEMVIDLSEEEGRSAPFYPDASIMSWDFSVFSMMGDTRSVEDIEAGTNSVQEEVVSAIGLAASDATSISLHLVDGRNVIATLENGSWAAWWPQTVDLEKMTSLPDPTITFITTDGQTHNYVP